MRKIFTSLAGAAILVAVAMPGIAAAQTTVGGTATLNGGALNLNAVAPVNFGSATLTGFGQTLSTANTAALQDARGTGAGWHLSIQASGLFTNGTHTLTDGSMTITSGSTTVAPGTWAGTQPNNTDNAYAYQVLASGAANIFNGTVNTGLGNGVINFGDSLAIPA